jgi:hypothetical protein
MSSSCADHLVTPHHTMLYESYGTWKECLAEDFFVKGAHLPVSGMMNRPDLDLYDSDDALRFHVWCVTDGHVYYVRKSDGLLHYRFGFKKQRKVQRLTALLDRLGYAYTVSHAQSALDVTRFTVKHVHPKFTKHLTEQHRQLSPRQASVLFLEWSHTDGSYASSHTDKHFQLSTNVKFHADLLQELAAVSGAKSTCAVATKGKYTPGYLLHIRLGVLKVRSDGINRSTVEYAGRVWCPSVAPHHTVIARRNGKVFISKQSNERARVG